MAATNAGQLDFVKTLIRKGALLNIYDKSGKTALTIAEEKNQIQIAEFFKSQKLAV